MSHSHHIIERCSPWTMVHTIIKVKRRRKTLRDVCLLLAIWVTFIKLPRSSNACLFSGLYVLVNDRVPAYLHNRPALDHFWAIRPDSHLTISIFAWYLPLKDWNLYYVFAHLFAIWPFLSLFDPTRIWPNDICIEPYSTI